MENNGKASKGEITEELVGLLNVNDEIKSAKELSRYRTDISYEMLMRNPGSLGKVVTWVRRLFK